MKVACFALLAALFGLAEAELQNVTVKVSCIIFIFGNQGLLRERSCATAAASRELRWRYGSV